MSMKSILEESRAKWAVLWWATGGCDVISQYSSLTMNRVFFFLCASSVDYQTGSPCLFECRIDTKPARAFCGNHSLIPIITPREELELHFYISTMTTHSLQKTLLLQRHFFPPSFNVTFPIWVNDALCGSIYNDLCFSSILLFQHRKLGGKSQREAKRAKSIIYSI